MARKRILSFSFLRDYMSAKGIEVVKVRRGLYRMKDQTFNSIESLREHICRFY